MKVFKILCIAAVAALLLAPAVAEARGPRFSFSFNIVDAFLAPPPPPVPVFVPCPPQPVTVVNEYYYYPCYPQPVYPVQPRCPHYPY